MCSVTPLSQLFNSNFTLPLRYSWYSTVDGSSNSSSNNISIPITSDHPSSADYYCWVYLAKSDNDNNKILIGIEKTTLKVKGMHINSL